MKIVTLLSIILSLTSAVDISYFAPYGISLDDQLDIGDDVASDAVTLLTPIVFYGQRHSKIYISTNGLVTFDQPIATYRGDLFPLSGNREGETVQAIAPFYADVDTDVTGAVFYRESNDTALLEQQALTINKAFDLPSDRQFEPTSIFVVTWSTVGSYRRQGQANTIQLLIATDGTESYALFLYVDGGFNWVDAVDTKLGVPALSAQAGFDSGDQGFAPVVLPDSGLPESINWVKTSNTYLPGLWAFKIGYLRSIEEPLNQAEVEVNGDTVESVKGCAGEKCHANASCTESCCECNEGYFGNGIGCLKAGEKIYRLGGDVLGRVNEQSVDEASIQVSVVVEGTRMYTALNRLPPLAGYPLQIAVPIGELIGWLFAGGEGPNGFYFTGAVLNYTATLSAGGEQLKIFISMNGDAPFAVRLTGSIPMNLFGKQAQFTQHTSDYAKSEPGVYRSRSARIYTVDELELLFNIEEVIEFVECGDKAPATYRVTHSDYFIQYNENNLHTQYSMISNTEQTDGSVCAVHDCHLNAECVPRGNLFSCLCKLGYEGNGRECTDTNECQAGTDTCHDYATCFNTQGGYICQCNTGYSGDGFFCAFEENRPTCRDLGCGEKAGCDYRGDRPFCYCLTGFTGNGYDCQPIVTTCQDIPEICDSNAECVYNPLSGRHECQCTQGFSGDGEMCDSPIDASCAFCSYYADCMENVRGYFHCVCRSGYTGNGESCFAFDGLEEVATSSPTSEATTPGASASTPRATESTLPEYTTIVTDSTPAGSTYGVTEPYLTTNTPAVPEPYSTTPTPAVPEPSSDVSRTTQTVRDQTTTRPISMEPSSPPPEPSTPLTEPSSPPPEPSTPLTEPSPDYSTSTTVTVPSDTTTANDDDRDDCRYNRDLCDVNAQCSPSRDGTYKCACNDGYYGPGTRCVEADCRSHAECGEGRLCRYSRELNKYECYTEQTEERTCAETPICSEEATCYDSVRGPQCVCNSGYQGDGLSCTRIPEVRTCAETPICSEEATCYDSVRGPQCVCNSGYQGDGLSCTRIPEVRTCAETPICSEEATCYDSARGPQCVCNSGYQGDGLSCTRIPETCATRPSMCDRNAVCSSDDTCICNPGFRGDGTTCTPLNEQANFLLFSRGQSVFRVPFYQAGVDRGQRLLYRHQQTIVGLAFDCEERDIFFSDISSGTISKTSLENTSDTEVIASGLSSPEGLAVDWVSRLLFVADSGLDTIEAISLDPVHISPEEGVSPGQAVYRRKVIANTNLTNPRAITVDPTAGRVFWADWDRAAPKIELANMDGSERQVLVDSDISLPNGLVYDAYRGELCWADAGTRRIECVNSYGGDRRIVFDYPTYPFSLTAFRDNFYWTDWQIASIQTVPRGGSVLGTSIAFPSGGRGKPYSITVGPSQCLPADNRCSKNADYCGGNLMCLPTGTSALCECPDNIPEEECNKIETRL